ncbi:hypothetical protein [Paenibacillus mendelii]|uniref:Uncharacterized protein n=1 Tax=Paenibacillus mendelii TaxID=206163 RepID=A0ABV6JEP6_9BACL|nr:hypothetical protein [Paenibacillus mendelii]MCQ6557252.1 hypothetical protein [Paenibacillus mendelii]
MKNWYKYCFFILTPLLILFGFIYFNYGSTNDKISSYLKERDNNFNGIIFTQIIGDEIISIYRTDEHKLGYGMFRDNRFGVKFIRSSGHIELISDKALTWSGSGAPEGELSILYGAVLDPNITQVIIISEGNKPANIIDNGVKIWYLTLRSKINDPITIKATDKDGNVLYEYGDPVYWKE